MRVVDNRMVGDILGRLVVGYGSSALLFVPVLLDFAEEHEEEDKDNKMEGRYIHPFSVVVSEA